MNFRILKFGVTRGSKIGRLSMKARRISVIAAAAIFGTFGIIAEAVPSAAHASVTMGSSQPAVTQKFEIESLDNIMTGERCLGNHGGLAGAWACSPSAADQNWHRANTNSSGYYQLENDDGQCLDIEGESLDVGAKVAIGTCHTSHLTQFWQIDFISSQTYECWVFNYDSGYVLEIQNGSSKDGAQVVQGIWNTNAVSQKWVIQNDSP
jgi:hypothetical protein